MPHFKVGAHLCLSGMRCSGPPSPHGVRVAASGLPRGGLSLRAGPWPHLPLEAGHLLPGEEQAALPEQVLQPQLARLSVGLAHVLHQVLWGQTGRRGLRLSQRLPPQTRAPLCLAPPPADPPPLVQDPSALSGSPVVYMGCRLGLSVSESPPSSSHPFYPLSSPISVREA